VPSLQVTFQVGVLVGVGVGVPPPPDCPLARFEL
jgi:hypothetical protein